MFENGEETCLITQLPRGSTAICSMLWSSTRELNHKNQYQFIKLVLWFITDNFKRTVLKTKMKSCDLSEKFLPCVQSSFLGRETSEFSSIGSKYSTLCCLSFKVTETYFWIFQKGCAKHFNVAPLKMCSLETSLHMWPYIAPETYRSLGQSRPNTTAVYLGLPCKWCRSPKNNWKTRRQINNSQS